MFINNNSIKEYTNSLIDNGHISVLKKFLRNIDKDQLSILTNCENGLLSRAIFNRKEKLIKYLSKQLIFLDIEKKTIGRTKFSFFLIS